MSSPPPFDRLSETRQGTLILRLNFDRRGNVLNGEIVDTGDHSLHRFISWEGLVQALREWLADQSQDGLSDRP